MMDYESTILQSIFNLRPKAEYIEIFDAVVNFSNVISSAPKIPIDVIAASQSLVRTVAALTPEQFQFLRQVFTVQ